MLIETYHLQKSSPAIDAGDTNSPLDPDCTRADIGALYFPQQCSGNRPVAITTAATNVGTTSAILNGTVNPNGLPTTVKFEYGTTTSYGSEIFAAQSPVSDTIAVPISAQLIDLSPNTTYSYRVVASNDSGPATGSNMTFRTTREGGPSSATTDTATDIDQTSATLPKSTKF